MKMTYFYIVSKSEGWYKPCVSDEDPLIDFPPDWQLHIIVDTPRANIIKNILIKKLETLDWYDDWIHCDLNEIQHIVECVNQSDRCEYIYKRGIAAGTSCSKSLNGGSAERLRCRDHINK